eukprot:CAMPEP_0197657636 /NCGR_PEP_ID=MMETSP1338-20131121/44749_1 /TAXON_ID=43686 ORGANISM="Pelagodinium beii, Strain RCC1491" /NCGR_SAMPLE_ID=MMETSP1338 /ASSEMBLY_ACC=CAM_ASM_000754 /LENGTH=487 /DNA_ID=CAMNT_0043234051 /DNA_START=52 /DNA_END=1515 /DNA_ORIENTATION=+
MRSALPAPWPQPLAVVTVLANPKATRIVRTVPGGAYSSKPLQALPCSSPQVQHQFQAFQPVRCLAGPVMPSSLPVFREASEPETMRSQVTGSASGPTKLAPGLLVKVNELSLEINELLGKGSFGTVWLATPAPISSMPRIALKELVCTTQDEVERAILEGHYLRKMSADTSKAAAGRVPELWAIEVERNEAEQSWLVRTAMTRLPGQALERKLTDTCPPEGQDIRRCFAEACCYAGQLLAQLAPALEAISECVYHRDVTTRNILVAEEGLSLTFGLVDFGLAVDAAQWRSGAYTSDLGGDGRYWPVSAWFAFEHGAKALDRHPALQQEYRTCIDVYGLGMSALRCLLELLPALPEDLQLEAMPSHALKKLKALQDIWAEHWADMRRFWQPVYEIFLAGGCFDLLREEYREVGVHQKVSENLAVLRVAVREARQACQNAAPESGLAGMPALFDALLLMIQPAEPLFEVDDQSAARGSSFHLHSPVTCY